MGSIPLEQLPDRIETVPVGAWVKIAQFLIPCSKTKDLIFSGILFIKPDSTCFSGTQRGNAPFSTANITDDS